MAHSRSREFDRLTRIAAHRYGIPASVLAAQQFTESGFDPNAVSPAGAFGLTQFMPGTAPSYGVKRGSSHHAVATQILGQAKYLHDLGGRHDLAGALAKYAGGPGNPQPSYARLVLGRARAYRHLDHGGAPASGGSGGGGGSPVRVTRSQVQPGGTGVAGLLSQVASQLKPQPQSPLPAPSFAAAAPLPKGYQDLSSGPPAPQVDQTDLLKAVQGLQAPGIAHSKVTGGAAPASGLGGSPGAGGIPDGRTKVTVAPGADRAGVPTSHYLQRILSGVRGIPGGITITTGSNHNRLTVNGNVSDHYDGRAGDIAVPVDSKRGDLIAGRVLMRLGVPREQARRMAQRGGLFNVEYGGHRWQVIWRTNLGGNHHNHVHVGVR